MDIFLSLIQEFFLVPSPSNMHKQNDDKICELCVTRRQQHPYLRGYKIQFSSLDHNPLPTCTHFLLKTDFFPCFKVIYQVIMPLFLEFLSCYKLWKLYTNHVIMSLSPENNLSPNNYFIPHFTWKEAKAPVT